MPNSSRLTYLRGVLYLQQHDPRFLSHRETGTIRICIFLLFWETVRCTRINFVISLIARWIEPASSDFITFSRLSHERHRRRSHFPCNFSYAICLPASIEPSQLWWKSKNFLSARSFGIRRSFSISWQNCIPWRYWRDTGHSTRTVDTKGSLSTNNLDYLRLLRAENWYCRATRIKCKI